MEKRAVIGMSRINRKLKSSFGKISKLYAKARPAYPPRMIDAIIKFSKLPPSGCVLDVGCGSGQASLPFARRGYDVTGLDISRQQIAVAKEHTKKFANIRYVIGSFEKTHLPAGSFNLIISGQAFHWIDPDIGYRKAYRLLRPGGTLALFWNLTDYRKATKFHRRIRDLLNDYRPIPSALRVTTEDLMARAVFRHPIKKDFFHSKKYSKKEYREFFATMSWISSAPLSKKKAFFKDLRAILKDKKEPIHITFRTQLLMAKKPKRRRTASH